MNLSWKIVAICLLGAAAGCAGKASPEQCAKVCEHVAKLRTSAQQKAALATLHEIDERVERTEDQSKENVERIRKEIAGGYPAFDDKPLRARRAPAKEIQTARERHQWEAEQVKKQRESAIQQAADAVVEEKRIYADTKKQLDADIAKAAGEVKARCAAECPGYPAPRAECLLRTQAVEDIDVCNAG